MIGRLSLVLVLALLSGCSHDSLDRESAAKAINSRFEMDQKHILFNLGRVGSHCETVVLPSGEPFESDQDPGKDTSALIAARAGYITVVPDGKDYWKVTLTDKGQAFLNQHPDHHVEIERTKGCEFRLVAFPVATASVVDVTGVTTGDVEREVDYTWKWVLTDLGVSLRENGEIYQKLTPHERDLLESSLNAGSIGPKLPLPIPDDKVNRATSNFKRYDKGWRLQ